MLHNIVVNTLRGIAAKIGLQRSASIVKTELTWTDKKALQFLYIYTGKIKRIYLSWRNFSTED